MHHVSIKGVHHDWLLLFKIPGHFFSKIEDLRNIFHNRSLSHTLSNAELQIHTSRGHCGLLML